MLAAGVLAAGASWWFRFAATHQAARFWGPEAAQLIRDAEQVDLLALEQTGGPVSDSLLTVAGVPWRIAGSHDVSQAPGLTHLRNALLEDRSFDWPAQDAPAGIEWTHGLRFRAGPAPPLVIPRRRGIPGHLLQADCQGPQGSDRRMDQPDGRRALATLATNYCLDAMRLCPIIRRPAEWIQDTEFGRQDLGPWSFLPALIPSPQPQLPCAPLPSSTKRAASAKRRRL
jgi:hypothetical protein